MKLLAISAVAVVAPAASAQFTFGGGDVIHIGGGPYGFTIADFNNDSRPDVAVSVDNTDKVEVYANDGNANFSIIGGPIFLGSALGPRDVVHADFDLDGDRDLAVAISRFDVIRLLTNDGAGNFTFGPLVPVGLFPTKLAAGFVDADANPDLLALNRDNGTVSALMNQLGSFQETAYPVGLDPQDVTLGDFNGDGHLDFATANLLGASVTVWYNNGDGIFSGRTDLPTIAPLLPYDIDGKDIDSDGDADIAVAGWGDDGSNGRVYGVNVFRSNGAGFDAPVFYSLRIWAGLEHEALTLGDFDSDGDYDILGGGNANGTLDFLINGGSGIFTTGYEMYGGNPLTEMQNHDMNGDLKPDLVMTHLVSGGGIGAHVDYFLNTSSSNWQQLPPSGMQLQPGRGMGGTMASLTAADNDYLTVAPGITFSSSQAPIQLEVEATSPLQSPQRMKVGIEAHAIAGGIRRTIEVYDFQAGVWETVDSAFLTRGDEMAWVDMTVAPRFVEAGTRTVRMRTSLRSTAPVFSYPWTAKIDRLAWAIK